LVDSSVRDITVRLEQTQSQARDLVDTLGTEADQLREAHRQQVLLLRSRIRELQDEAQADDAKLVDTVANMLAQRRSRAEQTLGDVVAAADSHCEASATHTARLVDQSRVVETAVGESSASLLATLRTTQAGVGERLGAAQAAHGEAAAAHAELVEAHATRLGQQLNAVGPDAVGRAQADVTGAVGLARRAVDEACQGAEAAAAQLQQLAATGIRGAQEASDAAVHSWRMARLEMEELASVQAGERGIAAAGLERGIEQLPKTVDGAAAGVQPTPSGGMTPKRRGYRSIEQWNVTRAHDDILQQLVADAGRAGGDDMGWTGMPADDDAHMAVSDDAEVHMVTDSSGRSSSSNSNGTLAPSPVERPESSLLRKRPSESAESPSTDHAGQRPTRRARNTLSAAQNEEDGEPSVFRAYIGFLWFFEHPLLPSDDAVEAVQRGVDAVVAQTPELTGRLRDDAKAQLVCVDYSDPPSAVRVEKRQADYAYDEMAACGFDQNRFPQIFDDIPGPTPAVDGLPVLVVQAVAMREGGLVLAVCCHHIAADATAAAAVAQRISLACSSEPGAPLGGDALWSDRRVVEKMLLHHEPRVLLCAGHDPVERGQRQHPATGLAVHGSMRRRQIRLGQEALELLKELARGHGCSTNALVMALLWRAWARALVAHGSQGTYSYSGGPVDMRSHGEPRMRSYLGNFIQPLPMAAERSIIVESTLVDVAMLVRRNFQTASLGGLRAHMDLSADGDIVADLAATDTPVLTYSNMSQLALGQISFGLGQPAAVHLRSFDASYMVFAISDGRGGIVANTVLPQSLFDALAADPELSRFAQLS
ncbi:hypothetical protein LPJ61_004949, partial [Coemansia biformis]